MGLRMAASTAVAPAMRLWVSRRADRHYGLRGSRHCAVSVIVRRGNDGQRFLSLPDLLGEPRSETDYQAVHAELMATKHGRDFLAEYARRNLDPETRKFVSTMARLELAMRDHQVPQISATMLQGLGDLARAIEQSEAVFGSG